MQDRFVGDVGDFGKYGFLRALASGDGREPGLKVGVVWFWVPNKNSGSAGKVTEYLKKEHKYKNCDPELFDALNRLVTDGRRQVASVSSESILPANSVFFGRAVAVGDDARERWHGEALATTAGCDLVFLDPDNGVAPESVGRNQAKAVHYVFRHEIGQYLDRGQSVIVYHHLGRHERHADQILGLLSALDQSWPEGCRPFAVRFHPYVARVFVVLPTLRHAATLRVRTERFVGGPWGAHFDLCVFETRSRLANLRDEILRVAAQHGAGNVSLFGSVARGTETADSDVDLLVDIVGETSPWFPGSLVADLQELIGRPVHVVIRRSLSPFIREAVLKEAEPL